MQLKLDCRHYRGEKPCRFGRLCEGCEQYAPMGTRVLIVKLDAIGDVARTTCLLPALRRKHEPVHITWLVAPNAVDLLSPNALIDVALPYDAASLERLRVEEFDMVLSLDKTPRACAAGMTAKAPIKYGFGLSEYGTVYALTEEAYYALALGLSDDLKFRRNTRTYQDVIFECVALKHDGEPYAIDIPEEAREFAANFYAQEGVGLDELVLGLNCGGGAAFANKMWAANECVEFIRLARQRFGAKIAIFGAERERPLLDAILARESEGVINTGLHGSLHQFSALLARCGVVVTGDSLGMHLAMAQNVPVVVLFGPTCHQEIEFYDRGEAIVSPLDCRPCYKAKCSRLPTCMQAIRPEDVIEACTRWLDK